MNDDRTTGLAGELGLSASPQTRLERLLQSGVLDLERTEAARLWLAETPTPLPVSGDRLWGKVEGMLLGLAIGDSLGRRSEGMLPAARFQKFGEIRDYPVHARAGYQALGVPSDDTQLAYWTLEHLLQYGRIQPAALLATFASRPIKGMGGTVKQALQRYQQGTPWTETGPASAGNGAIMRVAPVLVPFLAAPSPDLWAETAVTAMITHNDAGSTAACLAWVDILWRLLALASVPEPDWWLQRYLSWAAPLEGEQRTYHPRGGRWASYFGPLWRYVEQVVQWADTQQATTLDACNAWYSGAFLMETLPSVIYILMRHAHDPEEAVVRAVNDTKDNDSIASLVASAVGALHGVEALPQRWRDNLTGSIRAEGGDGGAIFALLAQARQRWGEGA